MQIAKYQQDDASEINITPLVDVMLVLLIVFMLTAPMLENRLNINLPKHNAEAIKQLNPDDLTINLTQTGELYLGEQKFKQINELIESLPLYGKIFLRGDAQLDYGQIMTVIAALNQQGYKNIVLLADAG